MSISFEQVPSALRVPGPYAEIDGSKALSVQGQDPHNALLIGLRLSTGSATEGQIKAIVGELDGDAFFDSKSQLANMCRAFKRLNKTARCSAMALDEDAGGTAATCTFPLTGTATETATLRVRIGDQRVSVAVDSGDAAADVAAALKTAIDATERMMWTTAVTTGTVTLTHRHKGETGNAFTLEIEAIPAGLACTPTQPTNGATNPDIATAIAALDDTRYDTVVVGITDDSNMDAIEAEMATRWGPLVKQPGMVIAAVGGAHAALTTYGNARNSQYSSVMGAGKSPTPPWIWASQVAARDAQRSDTQPNRPRNGLTLPDCEAPKSTERLDLEERNLLLYDGISTFKVDQSGNVLIERLVTTYQLNTAGLADATYLAIETLRNLAGLYIEALTVAGKYDSHLLVPDGTNVSPGVPAVTPKGFRGELIAWYDGAISRGRTKDAAGFATDLIVEINSPDVERLDVQMAPRLVNGLVVLAMKISFQL